MSGRTENKKISRPKVSFSQSEQAKAETTRQHEDETTRLESKSHNAPKIRSSTTLDVPVIDPKKAASDKLVSSSECKTDGSAHTGDIMSENVETKLEARATAVQDRPSTAEALCVVRGARKDVKEKPKLLPQLESTIDNIKKNYVNLKQKEKKDMAKGGKPQAAPARGVARAGNQTSKPGVANVRSTISSLDPGCTPYHKIMANSKLFPVKKSICSDVSEARIKEQFVHIIQPLHRQNKASSTFYIGSNLEHPKCNSIECIGDNLRKLQQQKIVAKMNDLSSLQKSLVVGKISAALNFELNNTIFKNLVDLNIDEEKLKVIVTRTKDPPPRKMDLAPNLNDFFVPEDLEEVCEAVQVKLRPSRIDDNWNAFKISDKILGWRDNLDDLNKIV